MEKDLSKHLEKVMDDIAKLSNDLTMLSEMDVESLSVEDVKRYVEELHNASSELTRLREIVDAPITTDVDDISRINECKDRLNELENKFDINQMIERYANTKVVDYVKTITAVEKHVHSLISSFSFELAELHEVNGEISELVTEYEGLKTNLNGIIGLINEISNPYSVSPKELKTRLDRIKNNIKIIKNKQINNYNRMVTVLNTRLDEISKMFEYMSEELRIQLVSMMPYPRLETYNGEIEKYNAKKYISSLNYEELKRQFLIFAEMKKMIDGRDNEKNPTKQEPSNGGEGGSENPSGEQIPEPSKNEHGDGGENGEEPPVVVDDLEAFLAEIKNIELRIVELDNSFKEEMTAEELTRYEDNIDYTDNLIELFITNLYDANDEIKNNDKIVERVRQCQKSMQIIKERLISRKKEICPELDEYKDLVNRVSRLEGSVSGTFDTLIEPSFDNNKVSGNALMAFANMLNRFANESRELQTEIDKLREDGVLTEEQYNNLLERLTNVNEQITYARERIAAFEEMKQNGFLDLLNGEISGLENAISRFEEMIEAAKAPVSKEERKRLDAEYRRLTNEIETIEKNIERYKDTDPQKYEAEQARLQNCKDRLEKASERYRKKCGFVVRNVRGAKKWFKKHPKVAMVAAGLAALTVSHFVLGPVIYPALVHGNLMIAQHAAWLRPLMLGCNKILSALGNISMSQVVLNGSVLNTLTTASGMILNPTVAGTSLLKGLAISGAGVGALVAPAVVALRKVMKKMNKNSNKVRNNTSNNMNNTQENNRGMEADGAYDVSPTQEKNEPKMSRDVKSVLKKLKSMSPEERQKVFDNSPELHELLDVQVQSKEKGRSI